MAEGSKLAIRYEPAMSRVEGLVEDSAGLEEALRAHFRFDNPEYDSVAHAECDGEGVEYPVPEHISFLSEDEGDWEALFLPTGLVWALESWCDAHGVELTFCDFPEWFFDPPEVPHIDAGIIPGITLRGYQLDAISKVLASRRGVLEIATGGGKSECAIALTLHLGKKTLCVTPDRAAMDNLADRFISRGVDVGKLGGGKKELDKNILVAVVNSLYSGIKRNDKKITDWIKDAEVLFADEAHHQKAASWIAVASMCQAEYRIFMSGTPYKNNNVRDDPALLHQDDSWLVGLSGKNLYFLPPKKLIQMGNLSPGVFVSFRAGGPNLRSIKWYPKVYEQGIVKNVARNEQIATLAMNLVHLDRVPLVSIEKLEHGRELQRLLWKGNRVPAACSYGSGVVYVPREVAVSAGARFEEAPIYETKDVYKRGKRKREKVVVGRDPNFVQVNPEEIDVVEWLRDGLVKVLIGSRIFDEVQNIPFLTDMINAAGGKASQRLRQKIGRILRRSKGKGTAWFWDPWDTSHFYLTNHSRKRKEVAGEEGYPLVLDPLFAGLMTSMRLDSIGNRIGEVTMKEKSIEVSVSLTIPLQGSGNNFFYVKPSVTLAGELEEGDDADKCAEILHHRAISMFVREACRQASLAGHIGNVGFEQAAKDFGSQSKEYLEGIGQ